MMYKALDLPLEDYVQEWQELWEEFDFTPSEPVSKEDALRIITALRTDLGILYEDIDASYEYDPVAAREAYGDMQVDLARELKWEQ